MATLNQIDIATRRFADARGALAELARTLNEEVEQLKRKHLPEIKRVKDRAVQRQTELRTMIEESPELFVKPRTLTLHGVRIGFVKAKGRIEWDDEAAVIARIRKLLPADQAELLIRVKEAVHKQAVYDLAAGDLKRLGIRIAGDGDEVLIKDTASDVDQLVDALLKEATEEIES